ncbi:hypothetical protein [Paracoccus sp. (in: a-proteobacteria)]|uniref:hypothetical protein n=1 Tax=Paracoccus sp. TaxID=267 RepID=UPI0033411533
MQTTDDIMSLIVEQPEQAAPAEVETPEVETGATDAQDVDGEVTADEDVAESVEGAEDDQDADQDEDQGQPEYLTVTVDGEEQQVTLDDLKRSFAGQGYIQKRMQENAAKAKEVEAVYQSFIAERAQLAHLVQQVQSGNLLAEPKKPDPALRQRDPIAFTTAWDAYHESKAAYDQQQSQIAQYTQQQSETQQRALAAYQAEQMRELSARLPDLADPEKGAVLARQLTEAATEYGFAPDEVGQVTDHRALLILHDAMKYRQLQGQREKAQAKAEQARPISKPKAQKTADSGKKQSEVARNRMRQTGNVDDVARFLIT